MKKPIIALHFMPLLWAVLCAGIAVANPCAPPGQPLNSKIVSGMETGQREAEQQWMAALSAFSCSFSAEAGSADMAAADKTWHEAFTRQKERIGRYQQDIMARMASESFKKHDADREYLERLATSNQPADVYDQRRLYVFVSESVPLATLRNLLMDLQDTKGVMLLRGLVGGNHKSFTATEQWTRQVLCGSVNITERSRCVSGPLDINPMLFRAFGIERVPAIAYLPEPSLLAGCFNGERLADENFLLWYGDMPLSHVLRRFQFARPADAELSRLAGMVNKSFNDGLGGLK